MAVTTNTRKLAALLGASGAGIGTDGLMQSAGIDTDMATQAELDAIPVFDDNIIQTNLALVAFKAATAGSLAKYNLQDQIIDDFADATGVDASASTNETLVSSTISGSGVTVGPVGGDSTDTSVSGYTTRVFTTSRALTVSVACNVSILVVGGGGSGGIDYGGGGGAGGLVYDSVYAVTPNTYDMVIGDGGAGQTTIDQDGNNGVDSTVTINGGAVQFTAKGGGGGGGENSADAPDGGSGGGDGYSGAGGDTTQAGTSQGVTPDVSIGYDGGVGIAGPNYNAGGGGGAGSVGQAATTSKSGNGGTGYNAGAIFGTAVGDSGWFASGGGGGWTTNGNSEEGTASSGGGTDGGEPHWGNSTAATDGTGGGSGGSASPDGTTSGDGGSGAILVRFANADFGTAFYNNMTLQSTDTTAEAVPTKADMVMLMEDTAGTSTINTDIKGFVSRDSGSTFTEGVLVDEGDWGTNKRILAFHDLSFTSSTGQAMCYKITTHNQAVGKQVKIHATSIGWK